jgi:hypothetical protein
MTLIRNESTSMSSSICPQSCPPMHRRLDRHHPLQNLAILWRTSGRDARICFSVNPSAFMRASLLSRGRMSSLRRAHRQARPPCANLAKHYRQTTLDSHLQFPGISGLPLSPAPIHPPKPRLENPCAKPFASSLRSLTSGRLKHPLAGSGQGPKGVTIHYSPPRWR